MPVAGSTVFDVSTNTLKNHNVLQFPCLLRAPKRGGVMPPNGPALQPAGHKGGTPALKGKKGQGANLSNPLTRCDASQHTAESTLPLPEGVNALACQQAQRPGTSAQVVANMVGLRRARGIPSGVSGGKWAGVWRACGRCSCGMKMP